MTQKELLDLITLKDKDEQDLKLFMESIKVGCPRLYDLVNTLNKAENFFNNIGNLIPEDIRATLQAALPFEEGVPFYNSICLTSEELRMWDQIRRNGLLASGLSPEDAAAQVDLYNQRAKDALAAALDALNNGPEKELNDLIRDLFNPPDQKPDGCELPEGESNYGNKVLKEPKELVNIQDDISNIIFDNILEDASRELSKTFNPFGKASIMEKILSDTEGNHYGLHRLYESWLFTRNTYHDSEPAGALKDERFVFGLDFIGEPRGFFPDSVGQHMKDQLTSEESPFLSVVEIEPEDTLMFYDPNSDLEYTVVKSFEKEQTNYSKFFTREVQTSPVTKYDLNGSVGFISDNLINPAQTLDYKINLSFPFKGLDLLLLERVSSTQLDELDVQVNPDLSFRNNVFNSFLLNKISSLTSKINLSQKENFEKTMTEVFNSTNLLLLENTNGFSFGFEEEDLEADDLRYVDPAPESEAYTHEESEKVLGKSYTDNSRVTFLNPEEYGGSFTVPPVYIRPKEQRGWLKYSKALFRKNKHAKHDWQIYLELAKRLDKKASLVTKAERLLIERLGPKFILDQGLRRGPYAGMTLNKLKKNAHGLDLGPLKTMLPQALKHKDKQIHLNVDFYQADLARVQAMMQNYDDSEILLIGRRHVRSNNSWLHNSYRLVKGKPRCTLMLHPDTAAQYGIEDGQDVKVTSRVGSVIVAAEVTDELMPNVVSIPHGFGHGRKGVKQKIAQAHAGVSVNDLTDDTLIDELSGNAAVNGVPVQLQAIHAEAAESDSSNSSSHSKAESGSAA